MLNNEIMAKMLLLEHSSINTTLGYDITTTTMAKNFITGHSKELQGSLFDGDIKYDEEMAYMGINIADASTK